MVCPNNVCSCTCTKRHRAVTIKGIDKTDGETIWEYGPGAFWRHHYGADAISGLVPNLSATLDTYAMAAGDYPAFNATHNRNTSSIIPNAVEGITITKLNSIDGTVIESAILKGFFLSDVTETSYSAGFGITINNAAALSGGDYVIVGQRLPFIEFVDYSSNTANKEYILHAHGQQAGNVYLKTRTSSETITIPFDSDAAAVEALFEATSDCVSATATGGPWPLNAIEIEVEWSAGSGDISGIAASPTYPITGPGTVYIWNTSYNGGDLSYTETITVTSVTIGSEWSLQFNGAGGLGVSSEFVYTAATTDVPTFIAAFEAALAAYQASHAGEANWSYVVLIDSTSHVLTIEYGQDARLLILNVDSSGATDTRLAGSCAAAYDTGTGLMTSAVGYSFGYSDGRTPTKMFTESDALPTITGLNVLGILGIGAGPSNSVIITPQVRNSGDSVKANVVEAWNIASGAWTFDWQVYCNATMLMPAIIICESGYVLCPIGAKRFDAVRDRTAAKLLVSDGTVTEVMTTYGTITPPDNWQATRMFDDTPGSYLTWGFEVTYEDQAPGANSYTINDRGIDAWADGDDFRLGAVPFAADSTAIYASQTRHITGNWRYDAIGSNTDDELFFKFLATYTARSAEPQQFRFKFERMPGTNYTDWLDWYATESEIETALNALLGSGNCALIDFGLDPTPVVNNPVALIEFNPLFRFYTDEGYTPGSGRIPAEYFQFRNDGALIGGVKIEMQNVTAFATPPGGMAAYSITDASLIWDRAFGSKGAVTITQPQYAWVQGDFVYAYGSMVDNEL